MIRGSAALLAALLLVPGCASTVEHSKPGEQELLAGSRLDLEVATVPFVLVSDVGVNDGGLWFLWLTPICTTLGLADLPLSFACDLLSCVPDLVEPIVHLPRALGPEPAAAR